MGRKNNRRTEQTKKELHAALMELMLECPIERIPVREICKKANLNRSTFYLHYIDQTALLEDAEQAVLQDIADRIDAVLTAPEPALALADVLENVKQTPEALRSLLGPYGSMRFRQHLIKSIGEIIQEHRSDSDSNAIDECTLAFTLGGSLQAVIEWMECDFNPAPKVLASRLLEHTKQLLQPD